jgi:hypothetical protein
MVKHGGWSNMLAGFVNHVGWFTIMQAHQPFKLINHAGWSTKQPGPTVDWANYAGWISLASWVYYVGLGNHASWLTVQAG